MEPMTHIQRIIGPYEERPAVCRDFDPRAVHVARWVAESIGSHLPGAHVEHIGSTSVAGCAGKGIVDLMLVYPEGQLAGTRPANDVPPRSDLVGGSHGLGNRENP